MARDRRELSPLFREKTGIDNVYFQAPKVNSLKYPCIIYSLERRENNFADDRIYKDMNHYTVTLIDRNPDNDYYIDQLLSIRYCSHERRFINDNLYHDVFDLYY